MNKSVRWTPDEVQTVVIYALATIKIDLMNSVPEDAEIVLDATIYDLFDHNYFSAAFDLIDMYGYWFKHFIYGQ
jgi:hypothetical protein